MICPWRFVDMLRERGIAFGTGVPCSYLTGLINAAIAHPGLEYVGAANEGDAVAIACGAELGGRSAAVMFQNSGFGNAVSPLTSLTSTFRIPLLVLVTWRGQPGGPADEPQHQLMGQITPRLFDLIGIPWRVLPDQEDQIAVALDAAVEHMRSVSLPYGLILRKNTLEACEPEQSSNGRPSADKAVVQASPKAAVHEPDDVLRVVQASLAPGDALLTTTGYTGRALYALGDHPSRFYMVGSMGCASSLALGLAKAQPRRKIIVLDGDGAFLMRMGAVAVVGHERPSNLVHVLLDNGVHDSTGGQPTVSPSIDPAGVAQTCGYPRSIRVASLDTLADVLRERNEMLTFLHVMTRPRSNRKLPRPHVAPAEVAARFRQWLRET